MSKSPRLDVKLLGREMEVNRKFLRLSIRSAARELGMPASSYLRIISGRGPSVINLIRILDWLGHTLNTYVRRMVRR